MTSLQFDRDISLAELLTPKVTLKLQEALCATLGEAWQIVDADGVPMVMGTDTAESDPITILLTVEIDRVGSLIAFDVAREYAIGAARWIELLLAAEYRYRMAADIHIEAVHADFAALQSKHAQLQESELKYRELATQLERRVAEQVQLITLSQRKLYQTEKMASVGSLAAGMAHEINTPIGFIRSNTNTAVTYVESLSAVLQAFHRDDAAEANRLWRDLDLDFVLEQFPAMLDESISGADRIARIVANLRKYANIDYSVSTSADLNDAVRTVMSIVGDQVSDKITLEADLQPLPPIECDQGRMNQMLLSIMQNAHLAISGSGSIHVATRLANSEICLAISDDGCGIAMDMLPRIFDPFFTTRDVGKGTGLGLTVAADIASAHGGRIEVESTVGVGSTFTIFIPLKK
jgi:two-component system NtrC family sensor kinase